MISPKEYSIKLPEYKKDMTSERQSISESNMTYEDVIPKARWQKQVLTIPEKEHRKIVRDAIYLFINKKYKFRAVEDIDNHYELYDSLTNDIDKCYVLQICPEFKRYRCILAPDRSEIHGWKWIKDRIL